MLNNTLANGFVAQLNINNDDEERKRERVRETDLSCKIESLSPSLLPFFHLLHLLLLCKLVSILRVKYLINTLNELLLDGFLFLFYYYYYFVLMADF